jgi:hypothetical protein
VLRLYQLDTAECDLSDAAMSASMPDIAGLGCLPEPHRLPLENAGAIADIAQFVAGQ